MKVSTHLIIYERNTNIKRSYDTLIQWFSDSAHWCAPELFQVRSVAVLRNLSRYEKQMYTKLLYYIISLRTLLVSLRHYYDSYRLLFLQPDSGPQVLHACKTRNKRG